MSSRFSERALTQKVQWREIEKDLMLTSGLHMRVYTHKHIHMHALTPQNRNRNSAYYLKFITPRPATFGGDCVCVCTHACVHVAHVYTYAIACVHVWQQKKISKRLYCSWLWILLGSNLQLILVFLCCRKTWE